MIVARRFARDRRRALVWWSIGVAAVIVLIAATFPSVAGDVDIEKMFEKMPPAIKMLAGAPEGIAITSAAGYLHSKLFALTLPMLFMIFGIGLGARAIAGDEGDGTLELLLANPVTRVRVALERLAAVVALVAALAAVAGVTVLISDAAVRTGLESIPIGKVVAATAASFAVAILHTALAFAIGCFTGKRAIAISVAAAVAIGGYLLQGLAVQSEALKTVAVISPWHWFLDRVIILDGASAGALALPLVLAAGLAAAGVAAFDRRDLR